MELGSAIGLGGTTTTNVALRETCCSATELPARLSNGCSHDSELRVCTVADIEQRVDPRPAIHAEDLRQERLTSYAVALALTFGAICVRFWGIRHPHQVVFDEVHFGGFANQYLRREYYFDVHPPLAKMLNALAGWFVGYDGNFAFKSIGDDYIEAGVPYVAMRSFVAIMGAVTVPLVYAIMRESGYPIAISAFSAFLVLFGGLKECSS